MFPPLTPPLKPRGEDQIEHAVILVIAVMFKNRIDL